MRVATAAIVLCFVVAAALNGDDTGDSASYIELRQYSHDAANEDASSGILGAYDPYYQKLAERVSDAVRSWPLPTAYTVAEFLVDFGREVGDSGRAHLCVDIAAPVDTPVYVVGPGRIVLVSYSDDLGNFVVVYHGNGVRTLYGHLGRFGALRKGDLVEQGQVVGFVGVTGRTDRSCLHFAITDGQVYFNPKPFLAAVRNSK